MTGSHLPRFRAAQTRIISAIALALASTCWGTGYFGPSDYLSRSEESIQASPEFYWESEVKRLASRFHPVEKLRLASLDSAQTGEEKAVPLLKATGEADVADFAAALKEGRIKPPDLAKATQQHQAARDLIATTEDKDTGALPEEFDSEFADYHRGAFAYRQGKEHWDEARKAWEALLARPTEKRHYRTVWAAFMLGKLAMKSGDYPAAVQWFQKTRELAKEGFADSLGMAADSYGWEGRCEWKQDHPEKAAPLFLTQLALGDESAVISLKALIPNRKDVEGMLNYDVPPDEKLNAKLTAAAKDPLLRQLLTAHILATESGTDWYEDRGKPSERCHRWLAVLKEAQINKVEDADYLGWVAYTDGAYDDAARWLELARPDTPAACWLRSKLQRRAGKLDEAAKSMQQAWQTIIQPGSYTGWKPAVPEDPRLGFSYESYGDNFSFSEAASGDLGLLRLSRGEFVQALDTFLKGKLWADAAYVAERVLTADELKAYVDKQPQGERQDSLRYLLGRRFVREDRYEEAAHYLKAPYDKLLAKYVQALRDGDDKKLSKRQRAEAWLTAAWIARYDGMELMGTEVAPDGFGSRGMFRDSEIARQRQAGLVEAKNDDENDDENDQARNARPVTGKPMVVQPTKEEQRRLARNTITPNVRYHYRVIAAALAVKGSRFLGDNTEELADVLNTAGLWTKDRDAKAADRIYNLIEKRCAKTKIGQAVLARHWFVDDEGPWRPAQKAALDALHKELGVPDEQP